MPIEDPQILFNGIFLQRAEPVAGENATSSAMRLSSLFSPLGVPGRVTAEDDLDKINDKQAADKKREIDREVTSAFRVRVSLPGNFGDRLVAKVQSLRALPTDKSLLSREDLGPSTALPGGPGWPKSEIYVTLYRLGKNQAVKPDTDSQGGSGRLSVAWQEYESREVVVLIADPRARKAYSSPSGSAGRQEIGEVGGKLQVADEKFQCRRCDRPEHFKSLKDQFNLSDSDFRELLAGGRYVRAILSVPPTAPSEPGEPSVVDVDGATATALAFFKKSAGRINELQDNYLAPSGVLEVTGWADVVPSAIQVALNEPVLNPAYLAVEAGLGVHLSSGDATLETTDHFTGGRAIGFAMDRSWRSGLLGYGPLGSAGFTSSLLTHLRQIPEIRRPRDGNEIEGKLLSPETIELHQGGNVHRFYPSQDGCGGEECKPGYVAAVLPSTRSCPKGYEEDAGGSFGNGASVCMPQGLYLRLVSNPGKTGWRLIGPNKDALCFDSNGTLVEISDRHYRGTAEQGSALSLGHDPFGQLVLATDDLGRRYRFEYEEDRTKVGPNPYGVLKKLTDFADRELKYEFDKERRLTKVVLPKVEIHGVNAGVVTPELTYQYWTGSVGPSSPLHGLDFPQLRLLSFRSPEYVGRGAFRLKLGYRSTTGQVEKIDYPSGKGWEFKYTPEAVALPVAAHSITPYALDTEYELENGRTHFRRESMPVFGKESSQLLVTEVGYKADGRVAFVKTPDTSKFDSKYPDDDAGAPSIDWLSKLNVVATTVTAGDPGKADYSAITTYSSEFGDDNFSKLVKDGMGRSIKIPVPVAKGQGTASFEFESVKSVSEFDPFGRSKSVKGGTPEDETLSEAEFGDDKAGRKGAGLLKKVIGGQEITEEYTRDERGNVTLVERSDDTSDKSDFDEWDRPYELTLGKSKGAAQPVDAKVYMTYDAAGHVTHVKRSQKGLTEPEVSIKYEYDDRERVRSMTQPLVAGPEPVPGSVKDRIEDFTFADTGLLQSRAVREGVATRYEYDEAGRLKGVKTGESGQRTVGYDEMGRVSMMTDGDRGIWRGKHDGWGRLYKETFPNDAVAERTFDKAGGLTSEVLLGANGETLQHLRNVEVTSFGALKQAVQEQGGAAGSLTTSRTFDTNGRLRTQLTKEGSANDRLDADVKYKTGTGLVSEVSSSSRKVAVTYERGSTWPKTIETSDGGAGCGTAAVSVTTTIKKRDAFGRVVDRSSNEGTEAHFDWDEPGNLLGMTTGPVSQQTEWDSAGKPTRVVRASGLPETRYGYDIEGRIKKQSTKAGSNTFTNEYSYDTSGRLKSVTYPDQSIEDYLEYVPNDLVKKVKLRSGVTLTNSYDKAGNLLSRIPDTAGSDVKDGGQSFSFDGGSRLTSAQRLLPAGGADAAASVTFSGYDNVGHPLNEIVGGRGPLVRKWDARGRETDVTLPNNPASEPAALHFKKDYENCSDRLLSVVSERAFGNLTPLGARWGWQGSLLLGTTTNGPLHTAHRYGYIGQTGGEQPPGSPGARMKLGTLTIGSAAGNGLDVNGILGTATGTTKWSQLAYGYRAGDSARLGRLVVNTGGSGSGAFTNQGFSYGPDGARRLGHAASGVGSLSVDPVPSPLHAYEYKYGDADELQRIIADGKSVDFTSGPLGRPASLRTEGITYPFSYDGAGRRTEDDRFVYTWYWYGKLATGTVKTGPYAGHQIRFRYDALGRLLTREHNGVLPSGVTDDAQRPFIDKREYVWDDKGLVRETSVGAEGAPRWRKSWIPGENNLDDQIQVLVERFTPPAPESLYAYLRDENGTVLGLVDDTSANPAKPRIPIRYLYTPFGEAHAETGPELGRAQFKSSAVQAITGSGAVTQNVSDPLHFAPGGLVLAFSLPLDLTAVDGIVLERCAPDGSCAALNAGQRAVGRSAEGSEQAVVLPLLGWERGYTYRLRLVGIKDGFGRVAGALSPIEFVIPAALPAGQVGIAGAVSLDRSYEVQFDSIRAAGETAGNEFPGGQPLLFQHSWTDPVLGIAYHRARWYDPRTASWLSEDPEGDVDSPNLYAFVGQRPHEKTDPLGLAASVSQSGVIIGIRPDGTR
ncbi:MAG: RHS repeat-associated core domain-containing protein, partial [Thermoanaerobaculia bacterium]